MVSTADLNEMAAIAIEAEDQATYERELLWRIERIVGFDVAFFKRPAGVGAIACGLDYDWLSTRERSLVDCQREVAGVLEVALQRRGVAVDVDVFGRRGLESKQYYQTLMRDVGGKSSALLPVVSHGRCLATLMLGLTSRTHRQREVELMEQFAPTLRLCEEYRAAHRRASHVREVQHHIGRASGSMAERAPEPLRSAGLQPPRGRVQQRLLLSAAERDVLSYLPLGYTNAEIARARGTSSRTVRNQLSTAYVKLGVATRAEAVARFTREPEE